MPCRYRQSSIQRVAVTRTVTANLHCKAFPLPLREIFTASCSPLPLQGNFIFIALLQLQLRLPLKESSAYRAVTVNNLRLNKRSLSQFIPWSPAEARLLPLLLDMFEPLAFSGNAKHRKN